MKSARAKKSVCKAELTGDGCLVVNGEATGTIHHSHDVIVNADGRVSGAIHAPRILVSGEVKGDLLAEVWIRVTGTGRVHGDMKAPRLDVQAGAKLHGRIVMRGRGQDAKDLDARAVDKLLAACPR